MHTNRQRGVALVTVLVVLLVLTALGLAASRLMTTEDRTSSRFESEKAALYVAEVGLRQGEAALAAVTFSNTNLTALLAHTAVARQDWRQHELSETIPPPAHPVLNDPSSWDVAHLGTYLIESPTSTVELANREITDDLAAARFTGGRRAMFSVYVRNNPDDTGGPVVNTDSRLRLISVGWITDVRGMPLAVKIIEEEFNYTGVSQAPSGQKQSNPGGTGSGMYGG